MSQANSISNSSHLLSHSSGIGYDIFNPLLQRWRRSQGQPIVMNDGRLVDICMCPLIFEPGTAWEYSTGIDWAGQMVERVNSTRLHEYMRTNICQPLGIKDLTFHLERREDIRKRMPDMSKREGEVHPMFGSTMNPEGKVVWTKDRVWGDPVEDDFGGAGGYATATDYSKILHSICSNDGKLLKKETVDEMFRPQLSEESQKHLTGLLTIWQLNNMFGGLPTGTEVDFGLGGLLCLNDLETTGRKKGSMSWGGLPNLVWWMDRQAGLSGIYASQVIPPGDPRSLEMARKFEGAMYERLKQSRGHL